MRCSSMRGRFCSFILADPEERAKSKVGGGGCPFPYIDN